jgi:hypothetical protein
MKSYFPRVSPVWIIAINPYQSAKAKSTEPESTQSVAIAEDKFELVMGIFEKVTYGTTEFLHQVSLFIRPLQYNTNFC